MKDSQRMSHRIIFGLLFLLASTANLACSSDKAPGGPKPIDPPAPAEGGALCVLSADCSEGLYCDLGECVQSCSSEVPCGSASAYCSQRGRCVAEGQEDSDPPPPTANLGSLEVDQTIVPLTQASRKVVLRLSSEADALVRYRIVPSAPYLSIDEPRGAFTGETIVELAVDPGMVEGREGVGAIKIFSTLGERVVETPIKIGLTGRYQGALRYTSGSTVLGDARISVDLMQRQGDVDVRFDPDTSLLFPAGSAGATTGFGSYSEEEGVDFIVLQRVDASAGGTRNHFARDLGRRISMHLEPNALGDLEGTFTETIHGLFEQPVQIGGEVTLRLRRGEPEPNFELSPDAQMPVFAAPARNYADVFGSNAYATCGDVMTAVYTGAGTWGNNRTAALAEAANYYKLDEAMQSRVAEGQTYADLMELCGNGLLVAKPTLVSVQCAWLPATACGVAIAAQRPDHFAEFNSFVPMALAPSLLIAQQHIVDALDASFTPGGLSAERKAYDDAAAALAGIGRWVLYPDHLDYLRGLSQEEARGAVPTAGQNRTEQETFPAGRALARLFHVLATIDGERARTAGIDSAASDAQLLKTAQERALITLLEAVTLLEVVKQWDLTPDVLEADLSGVLNPLDVGFGALLEGARAFGVPEGFVPFVWRPEDVGKGATNFEQMLALAGETLSGEKALEDAYMSNKRAFEASETELLREAQNLKLTYDAQIADVCGDGFDLDGVTQEADWQACGADDQGEVGVLLLDVALMGARLEAAHSRLRGLADKIQIDKDTLARTQGVRTSTLRFIDSTGSQLDTLTMTEGTLNAIQAFLNIAANAQVLNFGTPYGMAAAAAAVEMKRTAIQVQRERLQRAQTMRFQQQDAQIELINGMANIQKQLIDLDQLGIEMMQDSLAQTQSQVRLGNAVERAKRLFALRRQAIAIAGKNPSHDPSFRMLRDRQGLQLLDARARAQRQLYLAARSLEYEVNTPLSSVGGAVLNARSSLALTQLANCLNEIHTSYRVAFGNPQSYTTEVSVREMLGIKGPRVDEVTGKELSPGEQFRQIAVRNTSWDVNGALTIIFSTNLQPGNGLWSTDVCNDRISNVQAQLVGDYLGDNEAQVNVSLTGAAVLRQCDSDGLQTWSMAEGTSASGAIAVVQAGVNSYGTAEPNHSLFGQSVARASWRITIPPGDTAPANADLDLATLEDIVLRIEHKAVPRRSTPLYVDTSCLAGIQ